MLKLNLGCGGNILEGFENHDSDIDITKPLPWGDNSVDFILAEHVCEHLSTPDFFRFLLESKRILAPGGTLRLCIPVLDRLDNEHARDIILGHGHLAAYTMGSLVRIVALADWGAMRINCPRDPVDGHFHEIGIEKDDLETCRLECIK